MTMIIALYQKQAASARGICALRVCINACKTLGKEMTGGCSCRRTLNKDSYHARYVRSRRRSCACDLPAEARRLFAAYSEPGADREMDLVRLATAVGVGGNVRRSTVPGISAFTRHSVPASRYMHRALAAATRSATTAEDSARR